MVLGKKYTVKIEGENEIVTPEEFKEMLDELFLLNGVLDIGDSIPWLAFLDLQGLDRWRTESSAVTVEWALSELLRKPEIFEKATEELDRVIGRERWVEEKDIVNLPFIDAIAKETMRLHPVAPMEDPSIWDNPNEFCPERFLGKGIDVKGQDFELLPFGAGRRMCPGYPLGIKVIQTSLANLLHGFKWKLPGDMKKEDLNMEEIFGLSTPRKFPLLVVAEPRLPSHVYSL
ncbi:hypothetical protein GH714_036192 [Hevea brasiliensis]|uniref:Cytochrome P450 n=1 Tax=Hevea brasiliensis TaxID=3981 RepID=A0A6A6NEL0_HEVBR|nr:hypothetical protein GH714_036192 [Hevea brasiliensis]